MSEKQNKRRRHEQTQIFDPISKKVRMIRSLEIKHHTIPCFDKEGQPTEESVKGVQFLVVGKVKEWPLWIPHNDFVEFNPDLNMTQLLGG